MGKFIACLIGILIILGICSLSGWIFMLLWNWLVPLFWAGAPILGFWQSLGVWVFLSIIAGLFKSGKND